MQALLEEGFSLCDQTDWQLDVFELANENILFAKFEIRCILRDSRSKIVLHEISNSNNFCMFLISNNFLCDEQKANNYCNVAPSTADSWNYVYTVSINANDDGMTIISTNDASRPNKMISMQERFCGNYHSTYSESWTGSAASHCVETRADTKNCVVNESVCSIWGIYDVEIYLRPARYGVLIKHMQDKGVLSLNSDGQTVYIKGSVGKAIFYFNQKSYLQCYFTPRMRVQMYTFRKI